MLQMKAFKLKLIKFGMLNWKIAQSLFLYTTGILPKREMKKY